MIHSGLVSVTFRQLTPAQIVSLVQQAGLEGVEWGGDVHVPHGLLPQAREVRRITEDAGLRVAAYGSYYRTWPVEPVPFETVLETALALGAPLVRIWAGKLASPLADPTYRARLSEQAARAAELARAAGLTVAFEYHRSTLTDTLASTLDLLQQANQPPSPPKVPVLGSYWQPPLGSSLEDNLQALSALRPYLRHLHVFHWQPDPRQPEQAQRRPLVEGQPAWLPYLQQVAALPGERFALLEFVENDDPQAFLRDAATLQAWLTAVQSPAAGA